MRRDRGVPRTARSSPRRGRWPGRRSRAPRPAAARRGSATSPARRGCSLRDCARRGERGDGEQRCGGVEEVRRPRVPAIAPRAPCAAGIAVGAGVFAILIITDMDDKVGVRAGRARGDAGKGELGRIVARLEGVVGRLQPAAGIADDDDAPNVGTGQRQADAADHRARRACRQRQVADGDRNADGLDARASTRSVAAVRYPRRSAPSSPCRGRRRARPGSSPPW